jgi:phosphoserine phosphatase RsbU/P
MTLKMIKMLLPAKWDRKFFLKSAVVAVVYYIFAELCFKFATYPDIGSTPIWIPAGFSIGVFLVWGYEFWIATLVGSIAANILIYATGGTFLDIALMLVISTSTIAGKLFSAYLTEQLTGQRYFLDRIKHVVSFIIFACFLTSLPIPIFCSALLCLVGKTPWSTYSTVVISWWLSDAFGILLLTSLMVAFSRDTRSFINLLKRRGLEASVILFLTLVVSQIVFSNGYPVEYMLIPLIIWTGFRFKAAGGTLLLLLQVSIALVSTSQGHGAFVRSSQTESLLLLQAFVAVITLTALISSAAVSENEQANVKLKEINATLEDKVWERTAALESANHKISALNENLKKDNLRLGAELDVARQIQQMILPNVEELQIEGLDIAGYMEPADEVGGDYYDVLNNDGVVTIGIGDVTGHGLESGILMLMAQTSIRTLQEMRETNPVRFLDILNRTLYKNVQRMNSDKSLTLAVLTYSQGQISISGQHEETILVRKSGAIERIDTMKLGFPIALDDDIADLIDHIQIDLQPGDGVVLYTDGISEAKDMQKKQYGVERLCLVISQNWRLTAEEIKEAIVVDVRQFIGEQKVFDDITLLVLKRQDEVIKGTLFHE